MGISKAYPLMRPMKSVGPAPKSCQWIEGDDGTKCGEPAVTGKPYCQPHCERAYRRKGQEKD